ncbi:MOSC domain-containing protein [Parafrankia sp. BMG5.11]|uniref:MOSC domain-containing protein n=1 Tax=Parafrankia sp. BMG5.11 TaxID=222540 RepID=UPI00103B886E|nr:MOSC domain-containing protein [Parafrankia sp. BMG5.11]TCJ39047.1 MOSC domain-containing protein [Parafrankia sp. BMG5.11]
MNEPHVFGLARSVAHHFSKLPCDSLCLIEGLGVEGDAHAGVTVQHLSRIKQDPDQPNLRQVHLIHAELLDNLVEHGYVLAPGALGENVTTRGIDLLALHEGTRLHIGEAVIRVTGLRNPCRQIDDFMPGLLKHMIEKRADGSLNRKCGVMAVVEHGGEIAVGAPIRIEEPAGPRRRLEPV